MTSIISYNVNGIRAAQKKGFLDWLQQEQPDVLCIQETKAQPDQLDQAILSPEGYHTYWYSAEKKGYSGVSIFSKVEPLQVVYGMGHELYDSEGRVIRADFPSFSVISAYFPSGTSGEVRQAIKEEFLRDFIPYINALKQEIPNIIISGDYNIAREARDIHDPVRNKKTSGFLPHERAWFDEFLNQGYVDTFREFESENGHYSWWSYRARARDNNKGWRIDYHIATDPLRSHLTAASILPDIKHSDHCPIRVELSLPLQG